MHQLKIVLSESGLVFVNGGSLTNHPDLETGVVIGTGAGLISSEYAHVLFPGKVRKEGVEL